ncbi:MAG: FAD-dependent oxidoreductase [Candidatus Sericytochromatia bacterium]|nr:FAD-dependent oxidoreductase [Candidatus Sericytochromatia bacterium]
MRDVIIIGGGLTGLTCARTCKEAGLDFLLLEAGAQLGGRVGSEHVNGFVLDKGFQIFLSAYPEARRWLDYDALDLKAFYPGALIQTRQGPVLLGDPLREPADALATTLARIGSLEDKLRVLKLREGLKRLPLEALTRYADRSTALELRQLGFSEGFIQRFFQPFLAGVFLEPELQTRADFFYFVMKMFSLGQATVPAAGMQAIPEQLARWIPAEHLRLKMPVAYADAGRVVLQNGENLPARAVVVATDYSTAARLLKLPPRRWNASRTLYFAAESSPLERPILMLNGQGTRPVNNLSVMSLVSADYAPAGQHLIALSLLGASAAIPLPEILPAVHRQLKGWFGDLAAGWELLKDLQIPQSLPLQSPLGGSMSGTRRLAPGLYLGGDHSENASINGAMRAGRLLAEQILQDLKG